MGDPKRPSFLALFSLFSPNEKKMRKKNMFFEKSIFNDFLDAKKVAPRSHRNHWPLSVQGVWAPWGTRGKQPT